MAQKLKQTAVNTFVRGLITEASPLTFPDNASVDELNCSLARTGVRSRRKGIEYETDFQLSSFFVTAGTLVHTETWENVANQAGVEFLVVQHGSTLHFYDKSSSPISAGLKSFSVDLNSFYANNGENISEARIDADSINGLLVVVSNAIEPFYIEYDPDTDTISTTQINPKVRDFEWQGNTEEYFKPVAQASVSEERKYDTWNAGWHDNNPLYNVPSQIGAYISTTGNWPPLTIPWHAAKEHEGDADTETFETNLFNRLFGGTSLTGNGHFILDLFNKDRTAAHINDPNYLGKDTITLPVEVDKTRFTAVAKYAGRVWFSGMSSKKNGSRVFFSPVVEGPQDLGKFYQAGDPTSEDQPDLVDSDGGVINIPSAANIKALFEWGNALLVFAENGVWEIGGVDSVFKATEFFVNRVPGAGGLFNPATLVDAEGTPVWWGNTAIFTVTKGEVSQSSEGQDLSKPTIQTFWEDIGSSFRAKAVGNYDALNKQIFWLYGDDATVDYKYNRILILDTLLQAFVPWRVQDEASNTNYIIGMSFFSGFGATENTFDVVSSGGSNDVVSNGGVDDVVASMFAQSVNGPTEIRFLVRDGDTDKITFATFTNTSFKDWGTVDYSSYAETAYDFEDDLTLRKNNLYVTCYFNLTETGFTGDEINGYDFVNPSGCILKSFWDLRNTVSGSQQVYRHLRPIVVDPGNLNSFDYPYNSIITRNRIRGRGRVLKLRFESETGKDFQLQGYEVINAANRGF